MTNQPEALRLVDALEINEANMDMHFAAATELRRLHEVNQELVGALHQIIALPEDSRIHYKVARKALLKAQGENNV